MLFDAPCKTGQLQVDETTVQVMAPFKRLVWSVLREAVTGISQQKGMLMVDLTIHTAQGSYPAQMLTKQNAAKFLALFPDSEVNMSQQVASISTPAQQPQVAPSSLVSIRRGKEWYHDPNRLTYVAIYTNEKAMRKEVEAAAQCGWMPQGTTVTAGHINVGRTMTKYVLTGGIGLMTGASRSKDKITITFVRTREWQAQNQNS